MSLTSPSRPGVLTNFWRTLGSAYLTSVLLFVIVGFSLLTLIIPQELAIESINAPNLFNRETFYWLKAAGILDIFHSGWFFSALILLILNLLSLCVQNFPHAWRQSRLKYPGAIHMGHALDEKRGEKYLGVEIPSSIGRETFRDLAASFARSRFGGRAFVVKDEGGLNELQISSQRGQYGPVALLLSCLGIFLTIVGAGLDFNRGFLGQMSIGEGSQVKFFQLLKGQIRDYPLLQEQGHAIPGFYEPDFQVGYKHFVLELDPATQKPKHYGSDLEIFQNGKKVASGFAGVNAPFEFQGIRFIQGEYLNAGQLEAEIKVSDGPVGHGEELLTAAANSGAHALADGEFSVLEIQNSEDLGASAQIKYREGKAELENFWIFERHPDYDFVHRKKSRFHFVLGKPKNRFSSQIILSKNPGWTLIWVGLIFFALNLFYGLLNDHRKIWLSWTNGKVSLAGSSSQIVLFQPSFERLIEKLKHRLARAEKGARATGTGT